MQVTQENILVVDYKTYKFSPSNPASIVLNKPFYIDATSAPDLIEYFSYTKENNKYTKQYISVPDDVFTVSDVKIGLWYTTTSIITPITQNYNNLKHEDMLTSYFKSIISNTNIIISDDFVQEFYNTADRCLSYQSGYTPTQKESILLPVNKPNGGMYLTDWTIPIVKTLTLVYDASNVKHTIDEHSLTISQDNSSVTFIIPSGTYNVYEYNEYIANYVDQYTNGIALYVNENHYLFDFFRYARNTTGGINITSPTSYFESLKFKLHNYYTDHTLFHHCNIPFNSQALRITSGNYSIDQLVNSFNNLTKRIECSFSTNESSNIIVKSNIPFIINPVSAIVTETTDISETFSNEHMLISVHPLINCTITYKDNTYTINDYISPAMLLKKIYELTGVITKVNNGIITCEEVISVSENPYFRFNSDKSVDNLCDLTCYDYNIIINTATLFIQSKQNYKIINNIPQNVLTPITHSFTATNITDLINLTTVQSFQDNVEIIN